MSWRCVPSAQSKRRRSPPRRTRSADGARWAVGALADVPRKTTSRSMPLHSLAASSLTLWQDELLADAHVGAVQVVRALDLPDRVADVASVMTIGDRPERLVRADGHDLLRAVCRRRAREGAPGEDGDCDDDEDPD